MLARKYLITIMIAGLALAACGSSSKSSDTNNTTTTVAAPKARPKITITAHDFSFDLPAQIPSGYVDVTLANKGREQHQVELVKLGSMTMAQFKKAADTTDIGAVKPGTVFVGGPNGAEPNTSTTATVKLDPGKYAITCFIPANSDGKPHAAHGMIGEVTVATTAASTDVAPAADATIVLGDFSFTVPPGFTGKGTLDISNQGNQVHEMILLKLAPGKTLADAKKYLLVPPGTPPPAGPPPFAPIPGIGGITGLSSQQHAWLDLNLTAGNYVLICFFPDTTKGGLPHALEGMVKEFTIS